MERLLQYCARPIFAALVPLPRKHRRRARLILLLEEGLTWVQIREKLSCNDTFISRWSQRFSEQRLAGLFSRPAGQPASKLTPALEARILEWTIRRKYSDIDSEAKKSRLLQRHGLKRLVIERCSVYERRHERCTRGSCWALGAQDPQAWYCS